MSLSEAATVARTVETASNNFKRKLTQVESLKVDTKVFLKADVISALKERVKGLDKQRHDESYLNLAGISKDIC